MIRKLLTFFKGGFMMSTVKNFYQILGVMQDANSEDIKKSYHNFAQKYHPDKNADPEAQMMFVQAKLAYQILMDEDQRKNYDDQHSTNKRSHRSEHFKTDQFSREVYKEDSFEDVFAYSSDHIQMGGNIHQDIYVNFVDAIKGITIEITFQRNSTCIFCKGSKCRPGTSPTRCNSCEGSGTTIYREEGIVTHLDCGRCKGSGLVIKHPCINCRATGILPQKITEKITLNPNSQHGQSIVFRERGHQGERGSNGDLIVKLHVKKDPRFRKVGEDIHTTEWITICQAVLGCRIMVDTIWGKKQVIIPQGSRDGSIILLKNEGAQLLKARGNHVALLKVAIPTQISDKQRKIFKELSKQQQPAHPQDEYSKPAFEEEDSIFSRMKKVFK